MLRWLKNLKNGKVSLRLPENLLMKVKTESRLKLILRINKAKTELRLRIRRVKIELNPKSKH